MIRRLPRPKCAARRLPPTSFGRPLSAALCHPSRLAARVARRYAPVRPGPPAAHRVGADSAGRSRRGQCSVLLTERTAHLHDHAGQISFPGGRVEKDDADAIATALREAHEEIGLPPRSGRCDRNVARIPDGHGLQGDAGHRSDRAPFSPVLDAFEVSEVFEVPLGISDGPDQSRAQHFSDGRAIATRTFYCDAVRDAGSRSRWPPLFHLGCDSCDSAQPVSVLTR